MKKYFPIIITIILLLQPLTAKGITSIEPDYEFQYPEGLNILYFAGDAFFHTAEGIETNWTRSGNTFLSYFDYDFEDLEEDDIDVLLLANQMESINYGNITAIVEWFSSGDKLLWIAGDNDFNSYYNPYNISNPLLEEIGTPLRLSYLSVEDDESNNGAPYRVLVNETGVASPFTNMVMDGVDQILMHGPTAVHYTVNGTEYDLRNATLGEGALSRVSIIANSSQAAVGFTSTFDSVPTVYNESDVTGNYPMLASDVQHNSVVVVSGDSIFLDYKLMYGTETEQGIPHQGALVVDRIISNYHNILDNTAPVIDAYEVEPANPSSSDSIVVAANVTDNEDIQSVILSYSTDGSTWTNVTMDKAEDFYATTVPPGKDGDEIKFRIYAIDINGNSAVSEIFSVMVSDPLSTEAPGIELSGFFLMTTVFSIVATYMVRKNID